MTKKTLAWELLGAVVGAGLASGREIASFFGRYGAWGYAGAALAAATLYLLGGAELPPAWRGRWPERLWRVLTSLLLVVTGGAMLAGAGEVAALTVPLHGAYWLGMAATLLLAWLLARYTVAGLAWVSRAMLTVLGGLILLGMTLPPMRAAALTEASVPSALLRGVTYGGFNAALMRPVMEGAQGMSYKTRRRCLLMACGMAGALLLAGQTVLMRHPALLGEAMPFVRLMAQLGRAGYVLGAAALYLAILSTLTVCIRSLGGGVIPLAGIILTALLGFSGVVDAAYPLLGGACAAMLALAALSGRRG